MNMIQIYNDVPGNIYVIELYYKINGGIMQILIFNFNPSLALWQLRLSGCVMK